MNLHERISKNLAEAENTVHTFRENKENIFSIGRALELMADSLKSGNKIISCGNGGSMCDAIHFAEELTGRFREDRKGMAAIAISDPGYISCVANDYGYEKVFSRFVESMGRKGDILLAISTSGNSPNVLRAVEAAKENGLKIVALTGKGGGKLADMCDVEIRAPYSDYADRAQEIHIKVIHCLIDGLESLVL
jgi:D-sedoheptulose 7-phosphate isomerase